MALTGREFEAIAAHTGAAYLRYSFTKGTAQEIDFLVGEFGLGPGMRVLDVGCGPGRHARALADLGVVAVGADISMTFLRAAGEGLWVRADARRLPFSRRSFDAAICLCQGGFGLLGGDEDALVLEQISLVVKKGGLVAVSGFSAYFALRHLEPDETFDAASGVSHEIAEVLDSCGRASSFDLWTTCFTPRELRLMAGAAGLKDPQVWSVRPGSYARRPPDLEHPELLLVARV